MTDRVFDAFLAGQHEAGMALAADSDLLELTPLHGSPPFLYVATFHCTGLVNVGGEVREAQEFQVGVRFPPDYLRRFDPFQVLTLLSPREAWHPNIRAPHLCVGVMLPGTTLTDLLYQCFDVITGNKVQMDEHDALNHAACAWARRNVERFPLDRRPLRRRRLDLTLPT